MRLAIVEKSKIWITISVIVIVIGILSMIFRGLNLGVDFAGGSLIYVNIGKDYDIGDIRHIVSSKGVSATVLRAGDKDQDVIIKMKTVDNQQEIQNEIIKELQEKYDLDSGQFSVDMVGPVIGKELTRNALTAVLIACVLMLGYIWFRFELRSGVAAIVALVHDVLVMFATVSLFQIQINSSFVAAMLTIIGYSINDTIVVFDRIRENSKRFGRKLSKNQIVNKSISETIVRSLNTSLTTLFAVAALYILGVASIKEFTLPLIAGIISGTYSSIFIASPIWALWDDKGASRKATA